MSAQIKSISVKRFKQLDDFQLELKDATVLIGANNAGKSSALQALHFAVSVAQTAKLVGEGVNWAKDKFQVSFNPISFSTRLLPTFCLWRTAGNSKSQRRRRSKLVSIAWMAPVVSSLSGAAEIETLPS